jgi:hypothetical protein
MEEEVEVVDDEWRLKLPVIGVEVTMGRGADRAPVSGSGEKTMERLYRRRRDDVRHRA